MGLKASQLVTANLVAEAVAAERERCARLADIAARDYAEIENARVMAVCIAKIIRGDQ